MAQKQKTLVCWVVETRGIPGTNFQNNLRQKFTTPQQAFHAMDAEIANWEDPDPANARVVEYVQTWKVIERPKNMESVASFPVKEGKNVTQEVLGKSREV